jgi:hypothetical protein
MIKLSLVLLVISYFTFSFYTPSSEEFIQVAVKNYLKNNLNKPESYESISFSKIDTLKKADITNNKISLYKITHTYFINNSENIKVNMTVSFYFDKEFRINKTNTNSINGDYGSLTGNVYWTYNKTIGNKADDGAEIELIALDTARHNLKYEVNTDMSGNYKIEKVLPGRYFEIIKSKNVKHCPEKHLFNLVLYNEEIKQIFSFNIKQYKKELEEIHKLDSVFQSIILDLDDSKYGGFEKRVQKYQTVEKSIREKSKKLIDKIPNDFKIKMKLYSSFENAFEFNIIRIEENNIKNESTDFGENCFE